MACANRIENISVQGEKLLLRGTLKTAKELKIPEKLQKVVQQHVT
jgi:hypothetical protein